MLELANNYKVYTTQMSIVKPKVFMRKFINNEKRGRNLKNNVLYCQKTKTQRTNWR